MLGRYHRIGVFGNLVDTIGITSQDLQRGPVIIFVLAKRWIATKHINRTGLRGFPNFQLDVASIFSLLNLHVGKFSTGKKHIRRKFSANVFIGLVLQFLTSKKYAASLLESFILGPGVFLLL